MEKLWGMECNHPSFENTNSCWDRMIISWDEDIKNDVPSKCPLRITINQLKLGQ